MPSYEVEIWFQIDEANSHADALEKIREALDCQPYSWTASDCVEIDA